MANNYCRRCGGYVPDDRGYPGRHYAEDCIASLASRLAILEDKTGESTPDTYDWDARRNDVK